MKTRVLFAKLPVFFHENLCLFMASSLAEACAGSTSQGRLHGSLLEIAGSHQRVVVGGIWVFPKIGIPQNGWFIMENCIKINWMIWGYHYFRKHPYNPQREKLSLKGKPGDI